MCIVVVVRDSSVVKATGYGPGIVPGGGEIFWLSTPALWPTQPPVRYVLGLIAGGKAAGA